MTNQSCKSVCTLVLDKLSRVSRALVLSLTLLPLGAAQTNSQTPAAKPDNPARADNINYDAVRAMALQSDGKIIVAGVTSEKPVQPWAAHGSLPFNFALARYSVDGSPDTSFGQGGRVVTDFAGNNDRVHAVALQPDGKIVLAGVTHWNDCDSDFALARYNSDGTPDNSFGQGGRVVTDFFSGNDTAFAVAIQSDGRIVVMGQAYNDRLNLALARYTQRGRLDPTFGKDGKVATPSNVFAYTRAISLRRDGSILVAGGSSACDADFGIATSFALTRYFADGRLDTSFAAEGTATASWRDPVVVASAMSIQPDGKTIMAGDTNIERRRGYFALQRFNEDGSLDDSFGHKGKVSTLFDHSARARAIGLRPDGSFVVAGSASRYSTDGSKAFAVARYSRNGELDLSFGKDGKVVTGCGGDGEPSSIALQPDGSIIVGGYVDRTRDVADFLLMRYDKGGALDSSFGNGGRVNADFSGVTDKSPALALKRTQESAAAHNPNCAGRVRIETVAVDPRLELRCDELKVTNLPGPSSGGSGSGTGKGTPGMGPGSGRGVGPGSGYNMGGGGPRLGGGSGGPATSVDQQPILLNNPVPRYTEEARKNKIQGTVTARVLIGADGSVKQVKIVRGLPDGLDEQAIQAAYQMRFRAAMKSGQPVAFWKNVLIEFTLPQK